MKRKAIICDIDNCLIDISGLEEVVGNADFKSDRYALEFFELNANDTRWVKKNQSLFDLVNLYHQDNYEIILLTARSKRLQSDTYKFLTSGNIRLPREIIIISRGIDEEGIPDYELKESKLQKILEDFDVELAIDDNQGNCDMFKRNGIFALKVVTNE